MDILTHGLLSVFATALCEKKIDTTSPQIAKKTGSANMKDFTQTYEDPERISPRGTNCPPASVACRIFFLFSSQKIG